MELKKIVFYTKEQGPGAFPFREAHVESFRRAAPGAEFVFAGWDDAVLLREAEDCTAAVVQNNHPLPVEFYAAAKNLQWVHCLMSGVDRMHIPDDRHITLTATKGTHDIPIAEHVLAMILSAARKMYLCRDHQADKAWIRPSGITELKGATAGIVGLGGIGTATAQLLGAVGMNVVATSASAPSGERRALLARYYPKEEFGQFLAECDYVVICVPLTETTRHMFGGEQFRQMKDSAWIVNVARGQIINEVELLEALRNGEIAGACLDVAAEEPRPGDDPLWGEPNAILTPHVANETPKKMDRIATLLREQMLRFLRDEPLLYEVK